MKNFYFSNTLLIRAKSATVALRSICCRIQKQTTLLVLSMLLLSFSSFGQDDPIKTFYSRNASGYWDEGSSWSFTDANNGGKNEAANEVPTANDIVTINNGSKIIVRTANATCDKLTLVAGSAVIKQVVLFLLGRILLLKLLPNLFLL